MWRSWLEIAGKRFTNSVRSIIDSASTSLKLGELGDEDTQCQHLFTSIFSDLRSNQIKLSQLLIEDSEISDLLVEFRYYRSRRRCNHKDEKIQFVESETGADFALSLSVDLEGVASTQRHVLAQAKLIESGKIRINSNQMVLLEESAGGELGLYAIWGEQTPPSVVTISNLKAVLRATKGRVKVANLKRFGRALSEYAVDDFLGLWHGADFYSKEYKETPPKQSHPVLFHLLHGPAPPPNVAFFGIFNANAIGAKPGFYIQGMDIPAGLEIP